MGRTARRSDSGQRDARSKLAEHRLSVLELAGELGNVAEACRQRRLASIPNGQQKCDQLTVRRSEV